MDHPLQDHAARKQLRAFVPGQLGQAQDYAAPVDALLQMACERAGEDCALVWKTGRLSFKDLDRAVTARARHLSTWFQTQFDRSVKGERIGIHVKKDPGAILLVFAALRAGAIVVPLNPALKEDQLQHIADNCHMAAAFLPGHLADTLAASGKAQTYWAGQDLNDGDVPSYNDLEAWRDFYGNGDLPRVAHQETALLFYTSGSTGLPKGVMVSHHSCVLGAASVAHYLGLSAKDRVLALLPLSFDYGFSQIVSTWMAGGSVVLHDFFLAGDVVKAVDRFGVTGLAAVPPLWHLLMDAAWSGDARQSLRFVTNSGGKLTLTLQERLRAALPNTEIFAMYGLTEAFRSTFTPPQALAQKPTSIGQAIPFADVFLLNEDGALADPGEAGEIIHTGPLVAQGYWNDPDRTAKRFCPVPDSLKPLVDTTYHDRCVFSGDYAYADEDGDLHFVGRRDAMIKVLGNRLSPQEIEDCAAAVDGVDHALAFGIVDERMGAKICLIIETQSMSPTIQQETLAAIRSQLPSYAAPSYFFQVSDFARTPNGKVDRPHIQQWAERCIAAGEGQI